MTVLFDDAVDAAVVVGADDLDAFRLMSPPQRDGAFLDVEREIRRLRSVQAAMITEVKQSGSYLFDGHRSVTNWVQAVTNQTHATASYEARVAAMLAFLPDVADAAAQGVLGADQIRLLAGLYVNDRVRDRLPDWAARLVGYACSLDARGFRQICGRWLAHADPDGAHRDHQRSRADRHVATNSAGADHVLHAEGDALTGAMLEEILAAHTQAEFLDDVAARAEAHGEHADQHPLARTAKQRRYDAFVAIFKKAAATTATTNREPLVNIVVSLQDCEHAINTVYNTGTATSPSSDRMRYCETTTGAYVDPHDLITALLTGRVRRVIVDSVGRVIDLGRRQRLFTGATREAVLLTHQRCINGGCGITATDIQIDHINEWASSRDGTTTQNGRPACGHHNRTKTTLKHTVTLDERGWHLYRPDGTEITPRPQPPASP